MSNKIQRNFKCPCGSGKKFKRCCEPTMLRARQQQRIQELHPIAQPTNCNSDIEFPIGLGAI